MAEDCYQAKECYVEMQTNIGTIIVELDYQNAPITANNFIKYAKNGFYTNTLFHRVINDFMIQGGGVSKFTGEFKNPTMSPIKNEASNGLSNLTGTIAMARTSDPNSATSQFFINTNDNLFLDYGSSSNPDGYAVFGNVVKGMEVAGKIENKPTYRTNEIDFPLEMVYIEKIFTSSSYDANVAKIRVSRSGSGTVISDIGGLNCGSICSLSRTANGQIKLTATAATGGLFAGWRGDCQGLNRTITLDLSKGNHNCTATFVKPITTAQ